MPINFRNVSIKQANEAMHSFVHQHLHYRFLQLIIQGWLSRCQRSIHETSSAISTKIAISSIPVQSVTKSTMQLASDVGKEAGTGTQSSDS